MKTIGAELFTTGYTSWRHPHAWDAVPNSSKFYIPSQNSIVNKKNCLQIPIQSSTLGYKLNPPLVSPTTCMRNGKDPVL